MTRYLSEDSAGSPFSQLFNAVYGCTVLECVWSSFLLRKYARRYASSGDDVIVYLDLVPDNSRLISVYRSLMDLTKDDLRVAVLPIVCAEYAFIRSIVGVPGTIASDEVLHEILTKSLDYSKSSFAKRHSQKWLRSFETFCKLFCAKCLNERCCSVDSNACASKPYFSGDCNCSDCSTRLTLLEKSVAYLGQLHIVPSCSGVTSGSLSWDDVLECSRKLCIEYNQWAIHYGKEPLFL